LIRIFISSDSGFNEYQVNKIIKKENPGLDPMNFSKYDCFQNSLKDIVLDCSSFSFFGDKKIVYVSNCYFIGDTVNKNFQNEDDLKSFSNYLDNLNPSTDLYLLANCKLGKNEIAKKLKKIAHITELSPLNELTLINEAKIYAEANDCLIDNDAAQLLVSRVNNDWNTFLNEIKKMCLYSKHITKIDVEKLIKKLPEDNVFEIMNALINNNVILALSIYRDLKFNGYTGYTILNILFSQFSFMTRVKFLSQKNLSNDSIADSLNCSTGRVYMTLKNSKNLSFNSLINILSTLSKLEWDSKIESDDIDLRLETFILSFDKYLY